LQYPVVCLQASYVSRIQPFRTWQSPSALYAVEHMKATALAQCPAWISIARRWSWKGAARISGTTLNSSQTCLLRFDGPRLGKIRGIVTGSNTLLHDPLCEILGIVPSQGCTTFSYCRRHYFYSYVVRPPMSSSYMY